MVPTPGSDQPKRLMSTPYNVVYSVENARFVRSRSHSPSNKYMRFLSTLTASVLGTLIALGLVLFFVFFFFFALSLAADTTPSVEPSSVLVVPVEGNIPERSSDSPFQQAFGEGPGYDLHDLQTALRNAGQDDRIDAVWLRLKGTSASWGTLEEVRAALTSAQDQGLPIVASSEEFGMGEKDYFLASAADSVFVGPQSSFEYNGFASNLVFFDGAFEMLNVEPEVVRAGKYKSAVEPFTRTDMSEANREQIEALLSTVNRQFVSTIAEARDMAEADLEVALINIAALEERLLGAGAMAGDDVERLFDALVREEADVAAHLVEGGADLTVVHPKGWTVLPLAAWAGFEDVVEAALAAGADVNAVIDTKMGPATALDAAREKGHASIERMLLEAGAKTAREVEAER